MSDYAGETWTVPEIMLAAQDIEANKTTLDKLLRRLPSVDTWITSLAIGIAARDLGISPMADTLLGQLRVNRERCHDEIMFKGSELVAAVPRVVQAFTLKDHIHPAMLDVNGLASQLTRDMINHREAWQHGDVVEDANGTVWKLIGGRKWVTFGSQLRHEWDVPKRPLELLQHAREKRSK